MPEAGSLTLAPRYHRSRYIARRHALDESRLRVDRCPACGSPDLRAIATVSNAHGEAVLERSWCEACTLVTFTRRPDADWYKRFYESAWDPRAASSVPKDASYDAITSVLLPFVPDKNARILEIGCGYGGALETMRRNGYERLYGLEASRKRAEHARSRGFQVALCTAEDLLTDPVIQSGAPYDAVFSWHVFEHVYEPGAAVENVARLLTPDGVVFVCVPHVEAEHMFFMAHYLPHIHSYNERSLSTVFERRGFRIEYIDNSLRIVARKAPTNSTPERADPQRYRQLLQQKLIRDFGLRALPQGFAGEATLHYSPYRGENEILEPSYGTTKPLDANASAIDRALGRGKVQLIGLDGTQSRLPLLRKIARRTLGRTLNEVVGELRVDSDDANAARVDRLNVVYPGNDILAYVK